VFDQIMNEKVIDMLELNAKIEDVPPGSPELAEASGPNPS